MVNESIEIVEVPEEIIVKKPESPLKQSIKEIFKHLLIYLGIFIGIILGFVLASEIVKMIKNLSPSFMPGLTVQQLQNFTDFGYIVAVIVGITIFYKTQKINFFQTVFYRQKKMTLEYFAVFAIILFGCQFIFL